MAQKKAKNWIALLSAATYFVLASNTIAQLPQPESPYLLLLIAAAALLVGIPSMAALLEFAFMALIWLVLAYWIPEGGNLWTLPVVVTAVTLLAHPLASRLSTLIVIVVTIAWIDFPTLISAVPDPVRISFIAAALLGPLTLAIGSLRGRFPPPKHIDVVLCSYSGNTAHFAQQFIEEARETGAKVTVHRMHFYADFEPELKGDALVVAYPVAAFSAFWPVVEFLFRDLPRAKGKPTYLLYTAAGGPENAHALPWLLLALKGYRVVGRCWGMYPFNWPTFRWGPDRMWRWWDRFYPMPGDGKLVTQAASSFCRGEPGGLGMVLWPSPLWFLALPTYNRWICKPLAYNYTRKGRCNGCELCVRICPSERLTLGDEGLPTGKGDCTFCFSCVNTCPTKAMQLLLFTEYGQPYRPRWKKYLVRKKKGA